MQLSRWRLVLEHTGPPGRPPVRVPPIAADRRCSADYGKGMGYMIDVVAADAPESFEDALACRDELLDAEFVEGEGDAAAAARLPSPDMVNLHNRLTTRFPCICDDPSGPWSDGPLINNFGCRATTLGLSFSRAAEVVPFVVETATAMGFWVVDVQEEAVHLPGGRVLRPASAPERVKEPRRWWRLWR